MAWGTGILTFPSASQLRIVDRLGNVGTVTDGGTSDVDHIVNGSIQIQMWDEPVFIQVTN